MLEFFIIADDLSGACDTAVQFRKFGYRTIVLNRTDGAQRLLDRYEAMAVTTNSRDLQPDAARRAVRGICPLIRALAPSRLYKKIDSTWRGNIGAELETLLETLQLQFAVICSVFPENRRIGLGGHLLVDGQLLHRTPMAKDPASPIREGYLPALLAGQTRLPVAHLSIDRVEAGREAIETAILEKINKGPSLFVADAVEPDHLDAIAGIFPDQPTTFILAGSAGLSAAMLRQQDRQLKRSSLPVLTVVGSAHPKNAVLIDKLLQTYSIRDLLIPWELLIRFEEEGLLKPLLSEASGVLSAGGDLVLRTTRSTEDGEKRLGFSGAEVADALSEGLRRFVRDLLAWSAVGGLMVTGGTTALKLLEGIGGEGIEVYREIEPGVPFGRVVGGNFDGLKIITKAGGFGTPDVFRLGIDAIKKRSK